MAITNSTQKTKYPEKSIPSGLANYKKEQQKKKARCRQKIILIKMVHKKNAGDYEMTIPADQKQHFNRAGRKITMNRADRRDQKFKRGAFREVKI